LEIGTLKAIKTLPLFCIVISTLIISGCNNKTGEINGSDDVKATAKGEIEYIWNELQPEIRPEDVRKIKDLLIEKILPIVPDREKRELNQIILYLDKIQKESPAYFKDEINLIQFYKTAMRLNRMNARLNPDNFDLHLIVATKYIEIAAILEGYAQTDKGMRIIEEFKNQGVLRSKTLVDIFPENARSYAQYAHALYIVEGKTKEAADLYKKCLELDEMSEYCRESYAILMEEFKSSSQ
jgi:tetratricopeptide (TPR) repeat protein